jgi:hypothetical protein
VGEVAKIGGSDWSTGFTMEIGIVDAQSSEVSQIDDTATQTLEVNEAHIWVRHERLGQLSWGQIGGSSRVDDATEMDLSETKVASHSAVEDIGGGFFLRRTDFDNSGGLTSVTWSDLIDHLPGVDGNLVRYDTPNMKGLSGWAEWGEDDVWEVDLAYGDPDPFEQDGAPQPSLFKGFQIAAAISFQGMTGDVDLPDNRVVSGSVSVLHQDTGLNLTIAAGQRVFTESVELTDGSMGKPQDASYYYVKPGLLLDISQAGKTAFYAEYGKWHNFLGQNADSEAVSGLAGIDEGDVCTIAEACLVSGSEASILGLGVVQHIDRADMQVYVGFRHYEAEVELADERGEPASSVPLEYFMTVMGGAVIEF